MTEDNVEVSVLGKDGGFKVGIPVTQFLLSIPRRITLHAGSFIHAQHLFSHFQF
jgi:hypothetical protein